MQYRGESEGVSPEELQCRVSSQRYFRTMSWCRLMLPAISVQPVPPSAYSLNPLCPIQDVFGADESAQVMLVVQKKIADEKWAHIEHQIH